VLFTPRPAGSPVALYVSGSPSGSLATSANDYGLVFGARQIPGFVSVGGWFTSLNATICMIQALGGTTGAVAP
jgi:hypothetical protein